ncbi:hypothetical protein LTR66_006064 [Elasticomyces elasticus]|nr:hypothetical protein LTR66_006064 [Elasticomyces elasticus]
MIIRSLLLRHGRQALAKPPVRAWKRCLTSHANVVQGVQSHPPYQDGPAKLPFEITAASRAQSEARTQGVSNIPKDDEDIVIENNLTEDYLNENDPAELNVAEDGVAEAYHDFQHQKEKLGQLGSSLSPYYQPHTLLSNPPSPKDITLELLLASQSHLGHNTSLWNPANARYIFGIRQGIHIISLDVTAAHLRRAAKVMSGVTARGGLVLFVGTRDGQERAVVKAAELAGGCHLFDRWIPGSITNGQQILGRCEMKVVDEFDREVRGFEQQLEDRAVLKPDLVVCLNPLENHVLLHECGMHGIPTIGIIDTDADPTWVTYPIPANDDSIRCVQVIAGVLGRAGQEGHAARLERAKAGLPPLYKSPHGLTTPDDSSPDANDDDDVAMPTDETAEEKELREFEEEEDEDAGATERWKEDMKSMRMYEMADFADFEEEDLEELEEIFMRKTRDADGREESLERIGKARQTAGLEVEDDEGPSDPAVEEEMAKSGAYGKELVKSEADEEEIAESNAYEKEMEPRNLTPLEEEERLAREKSDVEEQKRANEWLQGYVKAQLAGQVPKLQMDDRNEPRRSTPSRRSNVTEAREARHKDQSRQTARDLSPMSKHNLSAKPHTPREAALTFDEIVAQASSDGSNESTPQSPLQQPEQDQAAPRRTMSRRESAEQEQQRSDEGSGHRRAPWE